MKALLYTTYVAVLIVMGAATFVESIQGTQFVHQHIYGTWWFSTLWGILAILGCAYILKMRERRPKVLLLHASFIIILAGALLTHLTGRNGTIHLRMGEPQSIAQVEHNGEQYLHRLNFWVKLTSFDITRDEDGNPTDYSSSFILQAPVTAYSNTRHTGDGDTLASLTVSMNRIATHGRLRFYQASYDHDMRGSTLMINRDPWGIPVTYAGYALLFLGFTVTCLTRTGSLKVWLPCIALTVLWCLYYFVLDGSWASIPVLRSPLLFVHVIIIIMAYALLLVQTTISSWALLRRKDTVVSVLKPALCLLSMGIFLGAIWANISWGNYWSWDSKEVWALITLMIYAVPVHRSSLPCFNRPTVFNAYMILAFTAVLMTYFGVNHLLVGLHSYN